MGCGFGLRLGTGCIKWLTKKFRIVFALKTEGSVFNAFRKRGLRDIYRPVSINNVCGRLNERNLGVAERGVKPLACLEEGMGKVYQVGITGLVERGVESLACVKEGDDKWFIKSASRRWCNNWLNWRETERKVGKVQDST